jgi:hypothetical protein
VTRGLKRARWPTTDADRAAFHSRYLFEVSDQPMAPIRIDRIEVTTEFPSPGADRGTPRAAERSLGTARNARRGRSAPAVARRGVVVEWNGRTLAQLTIDFGSLE